MLASFASPAPHERAHRRRSMATKTRGKTKKTAKQTKPAKAKATKPSKATKATKAPPAKAPANVKSAAKSKTVAVTAAPKTAARGAPKTSAGKPSLTTLAYAILYVKDMNRGVAFYRDVLGVPVRFGDAEWTELEMKGFTLALHRADVIPTGLDRAAVPELCFATDDVRATRAQLVKAGVSVADLAAVCEHGGAVGVFAPFRDPDGNHLSIYGFIPKAEWKG
jgi:predicted enzyme related to lactoylglutathione lyase